MQCRRLNRERAFTLIELLVVILIIGILLAVALPSFLGQTAKAEDSVARQNLYTAYVDGKAAYTENDAAYPTVGDPAPNPSALVAALQAAEPALAFNTACSNPTTGGGCAGTDQGAGYSPTDVNDIGVYEPNPQSVGYVDESASGSIFCLVATEQSNYSSDGAPATFTYLEGPPSTPCDQAVSPIIPSPTCPTGSTCSTGTGTGTGSTGPTGTGNCPSGDYTDINTGDCEPYWPTVNGSGRGVAFQGPIISDLVLNETNAGESSVPGGDVRFTADINANGDTGDTYDFQWSKSKDFGGGNAVDEPASPYTLDTHTGALDYHADLPLSTFGTSYSGPIYWRVVAVQQPTGFQTVSTGVASFEVSGGSTVSGDHNVGDNGQDIGGSGDNDSSESDASNSGTGGTGGTGPTGGSGNTVELDSYSLSSCVGPHYSDCYATRTVTDITSPATIGADVPTQYAFDTQRSADNSSTPADFYRITVPANGEVDIPVRAGVTYSAWGCGSGCSYGYSELTAYNQNSSTVDGIWAVSAANGSTSLVIEVDNPANFSSPTTVTAYPRPGNVVAPSITDMDGIQVDQLSANTGTWNTAPGDNPYPISSYSYAWEICDSAGNNCSQVNDNSTSYATGPTFVPFFPEYDQTPANSNPQGTFRVFVSATSQSGESRSASAESTPYTIPTYTSPYDVLPISLPNNHGQFELFAAPIIYDPTGGGYAASGYGQSGEDGLEEADLPAAVSGTQQQPGTGGANNNADYYYLIAPAGESLTLTSTFSGPATGVEYHIYNYEDSGGVWNWTLVSTLSSVNPGSVSTTVPSNNTDNIGNDSMVIEVGDDSASSNDPYTMTVTSP